MKRYSKVFKNRQVLTSDEMNDIVDVINDIISQFNKSSEDSYFRLIVSPETIIKGRESRVTISIEQVDPSIDISKIKIYWDRNNFEQIPGSEGKTNFPIVLSETRTIKAVLNGVTDTGGSITRTAVVKAISPSYFGSSKSLDTLLNEIKSGELDSTIQVKKYAEVVSDELTFNILEGEDLYFIIPVGVELDPNNVYLDSLLLPIKRLATQNINGVDYKVYKSTGGEFSETEQTGFSEGTEIVIEIIA